MWRYEYEDYPEDHRLVHDWVEPGRGIVGCEMHEYNGYGERFDFPKEKRSGFLTLLADLFRRKRPE